MYRITYRKKKKVVDAFSERVFHLHTENILAEPSHTERKKLFPCDFLCLLSASPWESKLFFNTSPICFFSRVGEGWNEGDCF